MPSRRRPKGIRVESLEDLHSERVLEAARLLLDPGRPGA